MVDYDFNRAERSNGQHIRFQAYFKQHKMSLKKVKIIRDIIGL